MISINEIFESVQGETSLFGLPTTFIRLSQCNLRCSWCDTPYSFPRGEKKEVKDLVNQTKTFGHPNVCVTGGEPLLQKEVHTLMQELCDQGFDVSIETGGSLPTKDVDSRVKVILDLKCPGSLMSEKNHWENIEILRPKDEVKFVILDLKDYNYAKEVCNKYNLFARENPPLFSPVFGQLEPRELVEWTLKDKLKVRLNMQMHKFIWHPTTRGV